METRKRKRGVEQREEKVSDFVSEIAYFAGGKNELCRHISSKTP